MKVRNETTLIEDILKMTPRQRRNLACLEAYPERVAIRRNAFFPVWDDVKDLIDLSEIEIAAVLTSGQEAPTTIGGSSSSVTGAGAGPGIPLGGGALF